ncbi:MAG: histidine phosphatase family protein [Actinomycetes bacterium]
MTSRLALLRHAKSAYPTGVSDYHRPLAERGQRDAPVAGQLLLSRLGVPDLALVSGAARTRQTLELARTGWPSQPHVVFDDRIYEASVDELMLLIREQEQRWDQIVLIGHNPGLEELAFTISDGGGEPSAIQAMGTKFPTSALAVFDVEVRWEHLAAGSGRLSTFDVARG